MRSRGGLWASIGCWVIGAGIFGLIFEWDAGNMQQIMNYYFIAIGEILLLIYILLNLEEHRYE